MRATTTKLIERYEELLTTVKKPKEKKNALVRSRDKSQWPTEDRPPWYSSRWKRKGQAEKEMDGQHCRVDRKELRHHPSSRPSPSEVETAGAAFSSSAPAPKTLGKVKGFVIVIVMLRLFRTSNILLLLLLVRQMETPVTSMKVAVHRRSPRLP